MKRFLFLICLLISSLNVFAEVKDENNLSEEKEFSCVSGIQNLYSGMTDAASFQIGADVWPSHINYCLNLGINAGKLTMKDGMVLLLKLKNGEIIELHNTNLITVDDIVHIKNKTIDHYEIYPSYPLSEQDINLLLENEVEKIRIECVQGFIDKKIKGFNKKFVKMYKSLNDYIENKRNSSVYDGF